VDYRVTVYLSKDVMRTLLMRSADEFKSALADQCHLEAYTLLVQADSHREAADVAFAVCNSSPTELHCGPGYRDDVILYRAAGNRSLSVGDAVRVAQLSSSREAWLGCAPVGWLALSLAGPPERP
jgi:hypothetical protein